MLEGERELSACGSKEGSDTPAGGGAPPKNATHTLERSPRLVVWSWLFMPAAILVSVAALISNLQNFEKSANTGISYTSTSLVAGTLAYTLMSLALIILQLYMLVKSYALQQLLRHLYSVLRMLQPGSFTPYNSNLLLVLVTISELYYLRYILIIIRLLINWISELNNIVDSEGILLLIYKIFSIIFGLYTIVLFMAFNLMFYSAIAILASGYTSVLAPSLYQRVRGNTQLQSSFLLKVEPSPDTEHADTLKMMTSAAESLELLHRTQRAFNQYFSLPVISLLVALGVTTIILIFSLSLAFSGSNWGRFGPDTITTLLYMIFYCCLPERVAQEVRVQAHILPYCYRNSW